MITIGEITAAAANVLPVFGVKNAYLFGSYANNTQNEKSDVDLLVEFESAAVSLLTLAALKQRLEETLKMPVDIVHAPLPEDSFLEVGETVLLYEA